MLLCDRYEVGDVIGRGGMGEVRAAFDDRLQRDVAIKFLRADLAAQPMIRARFEDEAHNAARLSHPNVVVVFDTGERDGQPFFVMERLPGRSLHDEFANGPLPASRVCELGEQVLAGLAAAHDLGILHRDITPSNVLLTDDGRAKIADFGIAKSLDGAGQTTLVGQVLGTPGFLAPERLRGEPATVASDLFSVGVLLNRALGDEPAPASLRHAIDAAMREDPAQRPSSAHEMRSMLLASDEPVEATTVLAVAPATVAAAPVDLLERVRTLPRDALVAVGIVLLGGLLLFGITRGDHTPALANDTTTSAPTTTAVTQPPTTVTTQRVVSVQVGPKGPGPGHAPKPKKHGRDD